MDIVGEEFPVGDVPPYYPGDEPIGPGMVPQFVPPESSSSGEKFPELAIDDLGVWPESAPSRTKKLDVDRRTQLSGNVMKKTIDDPSSLLRKLERAPPTRELMAIRQREMDFGSRGLFEVPNDDTLPEPLRALIQRTMHSKKELALPTGAGALIDPGRAGPLDLPDQPRYEPDREEEYQLPYRTEDITGETTGGDTTGIPITRDDQDYDRPQGLRITQRTAAMHTFLEKRFTASVPQLSFNSLFENKKKRTVAVGFFELLNIRSKNCINMSQAVSYGDIVITKTEHFSKLTS